MTLTNTKANYRCLPHTLVKCGSRPHKSFMSGNHNKWAFDLKGERIVRGTVYIDRRSYLT